MPRPWSAGNTPVRMVGALMGLGVVVGFAATLLFPLTGLPIGRWWPAAAMALACGGTLIFVGTRANSGGTVGEDGVVARYLLRPERALPHAEIAWAYLHRTKTTLIFLAASDEALRLVAYDGTSLQLSLPPRGRAREEALAALEAIEAKLSRAYLGYTPEAERAWARQVEDPAAWRRLVEAQSRQGRQGRKLV